MKFGTLQVYPRQGVLIEHGLDLPSAIVGRGEGAHILIDDFSVSRRHARLTVDSGRLLVEDLGSAGGTFVDGQRLEPAVRHLLGPDSVVRFGEIEARYLDNEPSDTTVRAATEEELEEIEGPSGLSAALASPRVPVDPGKFVTASVTVVNRGRQVDNIRITIPDLPEDWYTIDSPEFPLLPGERADLVIALHPPRRHDSIAGDYDFTVSAASREYDHHAEASGSFQILPFEAVELSLEALRSKKRFKVIAENKSNDVVRYELAGRDDEAMFRYDFETPAIELQPGQKRIVPLTVRKPRKFFGPAMPLPFAVVGHSSSGAEITTRGQLATNPPLQRFRLPAIYSLMALVLLGTLLAVLVLTDGNGTKTASAEDPYAGVHLCDDTNAKAKQDEKNKDAANDKPLTSATVVGPSDAGRPLFGQVDKNGAPFFAQNDARWATQEYARSTELPNGRDWCGTTIEQCGCAMTSVTTMLALYEIVQMPDGTPLSPKALNDWFNGNARKTDRGWVSRGYIYGDVIWSAANELSGEIAKTNPNARTVRFVRTGSGSEEEIKAELLAGRPVVLEVPGHWIAAVGLDGDQILINDPYYRDKKTLDAYAGKVRSSVIFEPSSDLSAVVITAPADVKFRITDKQGRVVATGTGTELSAADAVNQIPGASVSAKKAWRDPTCIEKAPPADAGTNQITLPGGKDDYKVEIIDTGDQPGSVDIHTYDKNGVGSMALLEGGAGASAEINFDPNKDKPSVNVITTGTPQATSTPNPDGGGGGGGASETPTPAPSVLPVPTVTQTPFVEQRTAMTLPAEPGQQRVEVATNSGFELGDPIRFAPGLPNEEDNLIVGFGSFILATPLKFAHSPGEPIQRLQRPPGQGPGLPPGITPPPATGPLEPPSNLVLQCNTIYQPSPKLATFICDLQITGGYTSTRWSINGKPIDDFTGSTSLIVGFPGDTPASVSATVCNVTLCRSTSKSEKVEFPPSGSGTGTASSGAGTNAVPTATPPAGTVTITCGTAFDQNVTPAVANINCQANFAGDFTSISWSAPGGSPSSANGPKKTFATQLINDLGAPTTVKITATVCNFGTCRTSNPLTVGVGQTKTIIDSEPQGAVHQRHTVTLFAAVVGLNGIVPQGGNVQFYADDIPINPSAALFTVGSTSVAQISIQTGSATGLTTVGTHHISAVYSGGINAFGSTSLSADLEVLPPLPDSCDSVDEDVNGVTDDFTTGSGDASCDITVPHNLGGGTILQSLSVSSGNAAHQDGAPNAVIVPPGQPLAISGTVGRTDYCPGCIRQVYLGIAGYDTQSPPTKVGPQCVYSGGMPLVPTASQTGTWFVNAPTTPGVYYVRATTTLDYFCIGPSVGPPDRSVGRIVVRGPVTTQVDVYLASSPTDGNPWDDAATSPTSSVQASQKLMILARVPAGATGRVDISGVGGSALAAPVCPSSGKLFIPSIQATLIACTPGEARVMSPVITDSFTNLQIRGRYENPFPAKLNSPATGAVIDYLFYQSPDPSGDESPPYPPLGASLWGSSNIVNLKVLVTADVAITASPGLPGNAVEMGQPFTLTATVGPQTPPTSGTASAFGGKVQFWAGGTKIGGEVAVDGSGVAAITWTPRNCNSVDAPNLIVDCVSTNEGFPFDTRDDNSGTGRPYYNDVHAEYITGGTSDIKSGTSSNINIDIDPATSTTSMTVSPTSISVGGTFDVEATVSVSGGFTPAGGTVQFKVRKSSQSAGSAVNLGAAASLADVGGGVWKASITGISTGADTDTIHEATDYVITAEFGGTSQVDGSTSPDATLSIGKASPSLTVTLPGSGTITVGDSGNIRAVVTGSPANRLDDSPARLKFFNGATQLADLAVSNLGGNVLGADFAVDGLNSGSYSITVEYVTNAYFGGTTSAAQAFLINQITPDLAINSITAVPVGDSLTVSASLTCGGSSCSGARTGTGGSVSFYKDSVAVGNLLGTDTSISVGGATSIAVTTGDGLMLSTAGTAYTIVAHFNGDATNGNLGAATSADASVTLTQRGSGNGRTVTSNPQTVIIGDTITLTATIASGSANVSPDCTSCVQFKVGAVESSATPIGTPQSVLSGTASLTGVTTGGGVGSFGSGGNYKVWAVYSGNTNVAGGSDDGTVTVTKATATLTAVASDVFIGSSSAVTVGITVDPSSASPDCTACITVKATGSTGGIVTVLQNLDYPANASFNLPTGAAATGGFANTCLTSAGTCTITVEYAGNAGVGVATDTDSFTITKASSSVSVSFADPGSTVTVGNTVDLVATVVVTGGSNVPTCTACLQFWVGSTTGTPIGTKQDVPVSGIVTLDNVPTGGSGPLQPGSLTIFAVYDTSAYVSGSNGSATLTIDKIVSSVVLGLAPAGGTMELGATVVLTATFTQAGGAAVPNCTNCVRFRLASANGTVLSTQGLTAAAGVTSATFTIVAGTTSNFTGLGSYNIYVVYDGTANIATTNTSTSLDITKASTSFTAFTATNSGAGQINLGATVTSAFGGSSAIDSGNIEFYANGVLFYTEAASNGNAQQNNVTLAAGTYTITAKYLGSTNYLASPLSTGISITIP